MPQLHETKILPYKAEDIFNLVLDVEKYPEFLPWVQSAKVYGHKEDLFLADLVIGYKFITEKYTSKVAFTPFESIHVDYVDGPFKWMKTDWTFDCLGDNKTLVDFQIDFQVNSTLFSGLLDSLMHDASRRLLSAFEERARVILRKY